MKYKICKSTDGIGYEIFVSSKIWENYIGFAETLEDAKEFIKDYCLNNRVWITCITMEGE